MENMANLLKTCNEVTGGLLDHLLQISGFDLSTSMTKPAFLYNKIYYVLLIRYLE